MFEGLQEPNWGGRNVTFADAGTGNSASQLMYDAATTEAGGGETVAGAIIDPIRHPDRYSEIYRASEARSRLVDNMFADQRALEEAYDRQIAVVKTMTGQDLENPLRGGYSTDAQRAIRDEVRSGGMQPIDAKGGIPEYQKRIYDQRLAALREQHPDTLSDVPDLAETAKSIASNADEWGTAQAGREDVNPIASFGAQFAGGMWAGRRDPLFVGSLFAGPTSAVGKAALTRIVSSGVFQGLYNAGISAMEQPAVQAWRQEVGLRSGVQPALENVGMAFLFGLIPGAAFRGVHEAIAGVREPIERVLAGRPEAGDAEAVTKALGDTLTPEQRGAIHMGEQMQEADRVTEPPRPADIPPELHHDMAAAELKRADQPDEPSAAAVAAVHSPDLQERIIAARPENLHDAQVAADEALDDIGRAEGMTVQRQQMAEQAQARAEQGAARLEVMTQRKRDDPMGKIPFLNEDGKPTLLTPAAAAKIGDRESEIGMLIRSCK